MHINKLSVNQFLNAEFRNGNMDLMLTEKGFMQAKEGMPQKPIEQHAENANAVHASGSAGASSNIMNKPQSEPMIPDASTTGTHTGTSSADKVYQHQQQTAAQTSVQANNAAQAKQQQATTGNMQAPEPNKPDMQEIKDIQNQLSSKGRKSDKIGYGKVLWPYIERRSYVVNAPLTARKVFEYLKVKLIERHCGFSLCIV